MPYGKPLSYFLKSPQTSDGIKSDLILYKVVATCVLYSFSLLKPAFVM